MKDVYILRVRFSKAILKDVPLLNEEQQCQAQVLAKFAQGKSEIGELN